MKRDALIRETSRKSATFADWTLTLQRTYDERHDGFDHWKFMTLPVTKNT